MMRAPEYHGHRPEFERGLQTIADTLAGFMAFHTERLDANEIPFAVDFYRERGHVHAFDPEWLLARRNYSAKHNQFNLLHDYEQAVKSTLKESWMQYLSMFGFRSSWPLLFDQNGARLTDRLYRFHTPYFSNLLNDSDAFARRFGETNEVKDDGILKLVRNGMGTGSTTTVRMKALLDGLFTPYIPMVLSKIDLFSVDAMFEELGLPTVYNNYEGTDDLRLIGESRLLLFMPRLKELGYGNHTENGSPMVIGCPASTKMTQETKNELMAIGAYFSGKTMLEEFAVRASADFDVTIRPFYEKLVADGNTDLIVDIQQRMLSGEALREAYEQNVTHCPYPHLSQK